MNRQTLQAAGWLGVGMLLMGLIVWFTLPSLMLIKHTSNLSYVDTVAALGEALKMFGGTIADVMGMAGNDLDEVVADVAAR